MAKKTKKNLRRTISACLLLTLFFLTGCGNPSAVQSYPPAEETVRAAAEKYGWTIDPEGTQSWTENQILYSIVSEDLPRATVSFALAEGSRVLTLHCFGNRTPEKPEFSWENWKEAVTLAESLYGGYSEGELYEALCRQGIPEQELPPAPSNAATGYERLRWEIDGPSGYGWVVRSIQAASSTHSFANTQIHEWSELFSLSLYESKEAYESLRQKS